MNKITKGPWRYKKAENHHHVLMGQESLDVNFEADARAIALVPKMVRFLERMQLSMSPNDYEQLIYEASQILKKLKGRRFR